MITTNKNLQKTLNIFSNGSLLTSVTCNNANKIQKVAFFEKDFKTFEKNSKIKSTKNIEVPNVLVNYRKKLFI